MVPRLSLLEESMENSYSIFEKQAVFISSCS